MKSEITILCDNNVSLPQALIGEHGFAAYVKVNDAVILFDTGQGLGLANNANVMKKDLAVIDKLVFSHGHFDHTGGLAQALGGSPGKEIIAHPDLFSDHYAEFPLPGGGKTQVFIGLKYSRNYIEGTLKARLNLTNEFREIVPGIFISGEVKRQTDFEKGDAQLVCCQDRQFIPDPFADDLSLLVDTAKGPVVVLGCAHAGLVNILKHFAEKTGHKRFYAVIGGTHLGFCSSQQMESTIEALKEFQVEKLAVSHCTGLKSASVLHRHLGDSFDFAGVGWTLLVC